MTDVNALLIANHRDAQARSGEGEERVADNRECDEQEQGRATPVSIGDPTTRVLVDAVEEIFRRAKETDGRDRRAETLQIFGRNRRQRFSPRFMSIIAIETATISGVRPKKARARARRVASTAILFEIQLGHKRRHP